MSLPLSTIPYANGVFKTPSALHPELSSTLHKLNAAPEHFAAVLDIIGAGRCSVNKLPRQLENAFRSLGKLPSPSVFAAACALLKVRICHLPSIGADELSKTARGYIAFLESTPRDEVRGLVDSFLQNCSAAGFSTGSVAQVLKYFALMESCGILSVADIGVVFVEILEKLPTKYPQRLTGMLMRRVAMQVLQGDAASKSPESDAILASVFGLEFAAVWREVSKAGDRQLATVARGVLQQIVAADVDMTTGVSGRSYYWGVDGYSAMERLANLVADALKSGPVMKSELGVALSRCFGTLSELAENLRQLDQSTTFESHLRRAAIAVESGGGSGRGSTVNLSPQVISAINGILDLSCGYEAIRDQLSGAFGADLNEALISRFGRDAAQAVIPLYPAEMDRARPAGWIIKGLNNEVFFPAQSNRDSEFDIDVVAAAEYFGRARELCDQAVFFFTNDNFGVLIPKDPVNRVRSKHFGLVVTAMGAGHSKVSLVTTEDLIEALKSGGKLSDVSALNSYVLFSDGELGESLKNRDVAKTVAVYADLLGLFRLRLSLWHKGYAPGLTEPELRSASSVRMLEECFVIHNIGHGLDLKAEMFPQLVLRPTFENCVALPSPFVIDTRTLTIQVDSNVYPLGAYKGGPDSKSFVLWHKYVVPYLQNVGSDIYFVRDGLVR